MKRILNLFCIFMLIPGIRTEAQENFRIAKMDSPDHRLVMRVISEAYKRLGIPVEFVEFPGRRSLYEANAGNVDGELTRIKEVEQEFTSLRRVPTPIYWFEATVFSKQKDLKINGWDSIRNLRVGIMRGMVYAERGVKDFPKVTVVDKPIHLFKMLDSDRIDVVIFSDINGSIIIKEQKLSAIHALKPGLDLIQGYHYVHKKHEDLVPKLDAIFQDMKNSGQIDRMRHEFVREFIE